MQMAKYGTHIDTDAIENDIINLAIRSCIEFGGFLLKFGACIRPVNFKCVIVDIIKLVTVATAISQNIAVSGVIQ